MIERYAVFAGIDYYPRGGWNDFQGSFADLDEAKSFVAKDLRGEDWFHVIDLHTGKEVFAS